jgi:hypothetical protein
MIVSTNLVLNRDNIIYGITAIKAIGVRYFRPIVSIVSTILICTPKNEQAKYKIIPNLNISNKQIALTIYNKEQEEIDLLIIIEK